MSAEMVELRIEETCTFATKIQLSTYASNEASKAAHMASNIANTSGSELHVLHLGNM